MFRQFVFLGAGVLTLVAALAAPGQVQAQHARGGTRQGAPTGLRSFRPGFGFDSVHRGMMDTPMMMNTRTMMDTRTTRRDFDRFEDRFESRFGRFDRFEDRFENRFRTGIMVDRPFRPRSNGLFLFDPFMGAIFVPSFAF